MADIFLYNGAANPNDIILGVQVPPVVVVPPPAPSNAPQGGTGGGGRGHGGAKWERVSTSDGAKPGQLSVKEQNLKELRELEQIEREIARQEQITARNAEVENARRSELARIRALTKEAKAEAGQLTAMAAAFARAGMILPPKSAEAIIDEFDEEEEEIVMIMAMLH